jgi:hypothetical protein
MNWLKHARREIQENARQPTANSAERNLTTVMAVPNLEMCKKSKGTVDAPAELEERQALAADRVPERYLDGWSRLQGQRPATIPELQWCQAVDGVGLASSSMNGEALPKPLPGRLVIFSMSHAVAGKVGSHGFSEASRCARLARIAQS